MFIIKKKWTTHFCFVHWPNLDPFTNTNYISLFGNWSVFSEESWVVVSFFFFLIKLLCLTGDICCVQEGKYFYCYLWSTLYPGCDGFIPGNPKFRPRYTAFIISVLFQKPGIFNKNKYFNFWQTTRQVMKN